MRNPSRIMRVWLFGFFFKAFVGAAKYCLVGEDNSKSLARG